MSDPTPRVKKQALREAITQKTEMLRAIERQRGALERELWGIEAELKALDAPRSAFRRKSPSSGAPAPLTGPEKIALFRSLFRGRRDVFPRLWMNSKTGRTGYAPACSNEWTRGVCEKPRVRCGECKNQAFLPVRDRVVLDHLQGRHVAGVYPLLADETCWLLAVDFDKGDWMTDVAAFRDACDSAGLPVAVERSRSGEGAHAWFFFDAPVSAAAARRMGCHLITRAMSRRPGLDLSSYDRLFPNQDTMPRGGFGNLIAMPLQREPRARGNTVFDDDDFRLYPDQWAYLADVKRIPASTVERVAAEALRRGQVLGIPVSSMEEEDPAAPWLLAPSRKSIPPALAIEEPLPACVPATLAQRLFIDKTGLPSPVINALMRLATFPNPEFHKRQGMRLSTALTPRVITCAEDSPRHVALPRGCVDDAATLLLSLGVTLEINDRRELGQAIEHRFRGTSTKFQENAVRALLAHDTGMLVAPPGVGKTVAGIRLIAERARNALVLVHRRPLLDQWVAQLELFLEVESGSIGRIGGGKRHVTELVDVAMVQSLARKDGGAELVAGYGHVVVDECHHVPAVSFERVLSNVRARYVTGLTATPRRRDGHHPILKMQLGPARYVADPKSLPAARPFARRLIVRETAFELMGGDSGLPIQRIYQILAGDETTQRPHSRRHHRLA